VAKRDNHYERAFEAYLRAYRVPYVAVDEQRRSLFGADSLKSLDFIVSPPGLSGPLLIDVKGRRFPSGGAASAGGRGARQYWKNWTTRDDVRSLARWRRLFGESATSLLTFAYDVCGDLAPSDARDLFACQGRIYGFVGIRLEQYVGAAKTLSPKWDTIAMPAAQFRRQARPLAEFLGLVSCRAGSASICGSFSGCGRSRSAGPAGNADYSSSATPRRADA